MVTRGKIRGNGSQLADYLLRDGANESVRVLDINGTAYPGNLKKSLLQMSLTTELSGRTKQGLYHCVINPAPAESYRMTDDDWIRAAEILARHTGFTGQPRAIVLHEKDGRIHAHCVYQRWSFERGKMLDNKFSRYKQNDARREIENTFGHLRTPDFNAKRPELRKLLSRLWQSDPSAEVFIAEALKHGYTVARDRDRRPFAIVNAAGRSFDLVREIKGVKTKDVRKKFTGVHLPDKKQIIKAMRREQKERKGQTDKERMINDLKQQLRRDPTKNKSRGR